LEGDRSKGKIKRATMPPEAQRADVCPEPPERLSDVAKEEWRAVAPELHRLGLLTVVDLTPLAMYCEAAAKQRHAEAAVAKLDGALTYTTAEGQKHVNPLVRIASSAANDAIKFGAHFGLTPISRLRLTGVTPPQGPSKFDGLLGA
jgi:P27 family predicted phage terminase small subunit